MNIRCPKPKRLPKKAASEPDGKKLTTPTRGCGTLFSMAQVPAEDYLLERKTENDLKDLLKTMVAFANSLAPGHTAVILIGEKDDGTVQGVSNADAIQKKVRQEAKKIYPDVIWRSTVYQKNDEQCVRVEIEHSGNTPHFGGPAWVRRGSVTVRASDEEFQRLVDIRGSVVRELAKWLDKNLSFIARTTYDTGSTFEHTDDAQLRLVNSFFATFEYRNKKHSYPLKDLTISWDDEKGRLKIILDQREIRRQTN
jgi:predicted HTH transcriptional regulator